MASTAFPPLDFTFGLLSLPVFKYSSCFSFPWFCAAPWEHSFKVPVSEPFSLSFLCYELPLLFVTIITYLLGFSYIPKCLKMMM